MIGKKTALGWDAPHVDLRTLLSDLFTSSPEAEHLDEYALVMEDAGQADDAVEGYGVGAEGALALVEIEAQEVKATPNATKPDGPLKVVSVEGIYDPCCPAPRSPRCRDFRDVTMQCCCECHAP